MCACMRVYECVCVEACANRRRNAIKWKLLKKAKMRNENSRHTLHCSPFAHHTHSLVFFLTPSLDNVTRQRVHCWRFCTNYAEKHVQARCVDVTLFSFDFSQIFLLILLFCCNLNLTLGRGGVLQKSTEQRRCYYIGLILIQNTFQRSRLVSQDA